MEANTRTENLMSGVDLEPITRKEVFLAKAAGMDVKTPEPVTREEMFLSRIGGGTSGGIPGAKPMVYFELDVHIEDNPRRVVFNLEQIQTVIENGMTIVLRHNTIASGILANKQSSFFVSKDTMYLINSSLGLCYRCYALGEYINDKPIEMVLDPDSFENGDEIITSVVLELTYGDIVGAYAVSV